MDRDILISKMEHSFRSVFRKLRQEIRAIFGDEISSNEFFILKILRYKGARRASDIAKEFSVSASHITALSDQLVQKGLLKRERSSADRRVVELAITEEGVQLADHLEKLKSDYLQKQFESFSNDELSQLIKLFSKLE